MALCSACRNISVLSLTQDLEDPPSWWGTVNNQSKPRGMLHLLSACQLKESAKSCSLCALIRAAILQYNGDQKFPRMTGSSAKTQEQWNVADFEAHLIDAPIYLRPKQDFLKRSFPEKSVPNAWHLRGFTAFVPVQEDVLTGVVQLFAQPDSAAAVSCDIIGRPALPSSNCPEAYTLLRRWISTCVHHHEACRETLSGALIVEAAPPILPTRILDIQLNGSRDPHLIETHGATGYYAALSHCWGPPHKRPIMTTLANYQSHKAGIPWANIPKAYQDAIVAVREIGLKYMWIDSLCIIQGDHDDWLKESSKMGDVYASARVTIAASHASDSSQGCFYERPELPPVIELPIPYKDGESAGSVFATAMQSDYADISPEFGVLASRAWATQEWLLSRRMIFYTRGCIVWSCKAITQRETGGSFHTTARNPKWKFIVEKYSARLLTNAGDRLVALEGLRREFQKKTKDAYWFGIWRNATPDQLLWYSVESAQRKRCPLDIPSWSWASTMHGIRFLNIKKAKNICKGIKFDDEKRILTVISQLKKVPKITSFVASDLSQSANPEYSLASARYETFKEELRYEQTPEMTCTLCTDLNETLGWAILDEGFSPTFISDLYCLALMTRKAKLTELPDTKGPSTAVNSGWQEDWVLLLQKSPVSKDAYVRIGAGKIFWKTWFHNEVVQQVRIL